MFVVHFWRISFSVQFFYLDKCPTNVSSINWTTFSFSRWSKKSTQKQWTVAKVEHLIERDMSLFYASYPLDLNQCVTLLYSLPWVITIDFMHWPRPISVMEIFDEDVVNDPCLWGRGWGKITNSILSLSLSFSTYFFTWVQSVSKWLIRSFSLVLMINREGFPWLSTDIICSCISISHGKGFYFEPMHRNEESKNIYQNSKRDNFFDLRKNTRSIHCSITSKDKTHSCAEKNRFL